MDEVTKKWEKLKLTDIEGDECALTEGAIEDSFAVVAKFFTKRKVNLEAVARTLRGAWKADGDFELRDLGNNRALIVFTDEVDMNRVLLQSPWSFYKYLLALHKLGDNECINSVCYDKVYFWVQISKLPSCHMTKVNGELIGSILGEIISVDAPEGGRVWGTCVRVRVKLDITKPLCRGRMVRLGCSNRRWVSFQYERLPIYCYWCGMLDNDEKNCRLWIQSNGSLNKEAQQYGPWLRASPKRLQKPQVVRVNGHDMQHNSPRATIAENNRREAVVQVQNTAVNENQMRNQSAVIFDSSVSSNLHILKNLEVPSNQNNCKEPMDFKAQIREIDKSLRKFVNKGQRLIARWI